MYHMRTCILNNHVKTCTYYKTGLFPISLEKLGKISREEAVVQIIGSKRNKIRVWNKSFKNISCPVLIFSLALQSNKTAAS